MGHFIRDGEKVYFTDYDGMTWRGYDLVFGPPHAPPHKKRVLSFGSPKASHRWFVNEDGKQRCHLFEKGDSRELTDGVVPHHLHRAGYVALVKFDPAKHMRR